MKRSTCGKRCGATLCLSPENQWSVCHTFLGYRQPVFSHDIISSVSIIGHHSSQLALVHFEVLRQYLIKYMWKKMCWNTSVASTMWHPTTTRILQSITACYQKAAQSLVMTTLWTCFNKARRMIHSTVENSIIHDGQTIVITLVSQKRAELWLHFWEKPFCRNQWNLSCNGVENIKTKKLSVLCPQCRKAIACSLWGISVWTQKGWNK